MNEESDWITGPSVGWIIQRLIYASKYHRSKPGVAGKPVKAYDVAQILAFISSLLESGESYSPHFAYQLDF